MAAAAEEKSESAPSGGAPAPSGGGSKLVLILTGVNLLATVGMVAVLFLSFQKDKHRSGVDDISAHGDAAAAHGEAKGEHGGGEHGDAKGGEHGKGKKPVDYGRMITLDQFTVNLSTPGSST